MLSSSKNHHDAEWDAATPEPCAHLIPPLLSPGRGLDSDWGPGITGDIRLQVLRGHWEPPRWSLTWLIQSCPLWLQVGVHTCAPLTLGQLKPLSAFPRCRVP